MNHKEANVIKLAIDELKKSECTFWACDGDTEPTQDMKTCSHCHAVKSLKRVVGMHEND
jgi:hypothetical protein